LISIWQVPHIVKYLAELWGLYERLRYAWRLGFRAVEVNVDFKVVVEAVHNKKNRNLVGRSLVDRICRLLGCDWVVKVQHI
jgi:ribonuclease HI